MPLADLFVNGVNGFTGGYVTPPLKPAVIAKLARGERIDADYLESLENLKFRNQPEYGPAERIDAIDLSSAGWGVVFPYDHDPKIYDSLHTLLDHRRAEASKLEERYFREITGEMGFRPGDSKRDFLLRNGALSGQAADPNNVPYYLLLVASPKDIPFEFQYQLDIEYAVGRLWFETENGQPDYAAFERYADSVVRAETQPPQLPRRAVFFGVKNDDDEATRLSVSFLAGRLAEELDELPNWDYCTLLAEGASKRRLGRLLGGDDTPSLLFTASHGIGFPTGDPLQVPHQGAILCQDWPGPTRWRGPIPPDYYFSADDLGVGARLNGLIAFLFACYGAGTPAGDDFAHVPELSRFSCAAPRPLVARLPQALLAHPGGGALAVVGHIDRAWSCSFFETDKFVAQIGTFRDTIERLLKGHRLGYALEFFNQYHSSVGTELGDILSRVYRLGYNPPETTLSYLWTTNNDARNYVVLGDPAVRLTAADVPSVRG
jgi:hypothetical protein